MPRKKKEEKQEEIEILGIEEIKENLSLYAKEKVNEEVEKSTKKLLKHKNIVIIRRDILIVLLIILCVVLGNMLYHITDIKIDITTDKTSNTKTEEKETTKEVTNIVEEYDKDTKELNTKYLSALSNISIYEKSSYINDYYNGNLTNEIKLYLAFNNLQSEYIHNDNNNIYFDKTNLENIYHNVIDGDFNPINFKYGDIDFNYLAFNNLFYASGEYSKLTSKIVRDVYKVEENNDVVVIYTTEGLVDNNKLYNITSNEEVKEYESSRTLDNYSSKLNNMKYTMKRYDNNFYKLVNIESVK